MRFSIQGPKKQLASVGWASGSPAPSEPQVDPNDVSVEHKNVRYFLDGAMVGILRSLRARRITGNLVGSDGQPMADIFVMEADDDGQKIRYEESAAKAILDFAQAGFFVIAPVLLGFDTPFPQYVWKSKDASAATGTDDFAVLIAPYKAHEAQTIAFDKESGG